MFTIDLRALDLPEGETARIAANFNGATMTIYVNGQEVSA